MKNYIQDKLGSTLVAVAELPWIGKTVCVGIALYGFIFNKSVMEE